MSELSRALEARLNKQSDSQTHKDEKKSPARTGVKPTPGKKPLPPPKSINSSVAKKINASLAQKDHKPPLLTPKPKIAAKPHSKSNSDSAAQPSPGVTALANVLQGNKKNTSVETNGVLPKNDTVVESTTDSGAPKEPEKSIASKVSPKLSRISKTKSVQISKNRSSSDATDRPFSTIDGSISFDDEFLDEGPRKRSSPVVTPTGSPLLAAHRKRRAITNASGSYEAPSLSTSSHQSSPEARSPKEPAEKDTDIDRFERSSSLPRGLSPGVREDKGQFKKLLSIQSEKVKANSASDLRTDKGAKRRPPPPPNKPRGSKPPVQPKPGGAKPAPPSKPPSMAALKDEPQFSRTRCSAPSSREVTPDLVTLGSKSPSPPPGKPSIDTDSLEETLKASLSSHCSEGIEETLKADNEESQEWVLVNRETSVGTNSPSQSTLSPTPPETKKPNPPPVARKANSSESPNMKRNTPTPPTPPVKPGKRSPTHGNMSPGTSPKPVPGDKSPITAPPVTSPKPVQDDDKLLKEEEASVNSSSSPSILVTATSSGEFETSLTKQKRSVSDLTRSGREKTDSGFGSEVPDDLGLVRRASSLESLPSSPSPPQVIVKDPEVWDEAKVSVHVLCGIAFYLVLRLVLSLEY